MLGAEALAGWLPADPVNRPSERLQVGLDLLAPPSRNGGELSPSASSASSVANPGPSVAISNRMPFGSLK